MASKDPGTYLELLSTLEHVQRVELAAYLWRARHEGLATPDDLTREHQLRIETDDLLTYVSCMCDGVTNARDCDCSRFQDWYDNRRALEELGVFPDGVRPATTLRIVTVKDMAAIAEDLLRLVSEGSRGRNFLIVSTSFEVYVQFNQFLEPVRDDFIRCEVASNDDVLGPTGREWLSSMNFQPPSTNEGSVGEGDNLIVSSPEDHYPNFHVEVHLLDDPQPVLASLAELTSNVFQTIFGMPGDAPLELELHIEAGV